MNDAIKVFQLNDYDWWAARSLDEAKVDYLQMAGETEEEDTFEDAHELTDEEMERLKYTDENEQTRTFKEQLAMMIAVGAEFPGIFASTEY